MTDSAQARVPSEIQPHDWDFSVWAAAVTGELRVAAEVSRLPPGARKRSKLASRWWHISNANLGRINPEFNGIQVSVGWHWFK